MTLGQHLLPAIHCAGAGHQPQLHKEHSLSSDTLLEKEEVANAYCTLTDIAFYQLTHHRPQAIAHSFASDLVEDPQTEPLRIRPVFHTPHFAASAKTNPNSPADVAVGLGEQYARPLRAAMSAPAKHARPLCDSLPGTCDLVRESALGRT